MLWLSSLIQERAACASHLFYKSNIEVLHMYSSHIQILTNAYIHPNRWISNNVNKNTEGTRNLLHYTHLWRFVWLSCVLKIISSNKHQWDVGLVIFHLKNQLSRRQSREGHNSLPYNNTNWRDCTTIIGRVVVGFGFRRGHVFLSLLKKNDIKWH